ncbi:hypothetical protein GOP47_0012480 [Adiantum capillus-veneris]|uniref:Uncharacterized protein n=1 Tax=Adiantum capillus-veneris TaxID=13818 RepID=A0A9D4UR85_ADICA|nr:hypothetical protein GOP47_0012480 [Adiantum capillus-veneris]
MSGRRTLHLLFTLEKKRGIMKLEKKKQQVARKVGGLFRTSNKWDVLLMVLGSLGALVAGSSLPFAAFLFGHVLDSMAFGPDAHSQLLHMSQAALHAMYLGLVAAVGYFFQVFCWMTTGERQAERMRCLYLQALLRQDMAFFDQEVSTGAIVEGISADTFAIKQATGEKVGKLVQIAGSVISGYVIAFTQGWKLTMFVSAVIPLILASGYAMNHGISKASKNVHEANGNAGKIVEQVISAIRTVIPFSGESGAVMAYKMALQKAERASFRESIAAGLGMGGILFFTFNVYAVMLWFGAQLIVQGSYTGGKVLAILFSIIIGTGALGQSSPSLAALAVGSVAAHKMSKVIKRVPMVDVTAEGGQKLNLLQGHIHFKNIKFAYPSRPGYEVLNNFTLAIPACTVAALVGESGSGKSTVACLLERFYDPLSGEILIDGIDLKNLNLSWFRRHVGLVSQDPILLGASLRDNIAYGREDATEEELHAAANLANASTFIASFPQGLSTMVGQGGLQLSGGQKQRIAIARAVLKDPRILILDEATSSLDAESENLVHKALEQIQVNRTTLIIAHRFTTVTQAYTIAVLHQGRIIEQGPHAELMSNPDGAFFQLVNAQNDQEERQRLNSIDEDACQLTSETSTPPLTTYHRGRHARQISSTRSMSFGSLVSMASIHEEDPELGCNASSDQYPLRCSHFVRLAAFNRPEIPVILLGSLAAGLNGAVMPVVGLLFAKIIHTFYQPLDEIHDGSLVWIHLFVVVAFVSLPLVPLQNACFCVAGEKLVRRIRLLTFHKVLHQKMAWFDNGENNSGIISSRLLHDASHMRCLVGDAMALIVQNLSTIVVGLFIAMSTCWQLALLFIGLLPFYGLDGIMQIKLGETLDIQAKAMYDETSQIAHEALSSIRTVASFCAEKKVFSFYQNKSIACVKAGVRRALIGGFGLGVSYVIMYGSLALSFWVGGRLVFSGKVTFDGFIKTFLAIELSAFAVSLSVAVFPDFASVKPAVASILSMLDLKCEDLSCGTKLKRLKGEVKFQNVYFSYPSRPDAQIFCDLSFTLQARKRLAIVGESGGGKSTVISLLQRFYDPQDGCILLDKVNIKDLQIRWLRKQMGLVSQEPFLFNDTIRANIKYGLAGDVEVSEEEMQKAADIANAHKFISSLPLGYDSMVGEKGVQLSGGQKQRIAIARAMVRDPKILLLDEATSALDSGAELHVQKALEKAVAGRSTLVVAHRLGTVRNANQIIVLKNGCIAEHGSHEELVVRKNGLYAALVRISSTSEMLDK